MAKSRSKASSNSLNRSNHSAQSSSEHTDDDVAASSSSSSSKANGNKNDTTTTVDGYFYDSVWMAVATFCVYRLAQSAYRIRMHAILEYGPVIHEFDPYFNYRATEYLYWNGAARFFRWFDAMSWYPLGRPVGTTIFPGMQFTAVYIKEYILPGWSINDVCCYIPVWFGVVATLVTGGIAYECAIPGNASQTIFGFLMDIVRGRKSAPLDNDNHNNGTHVPRAANLLWSPAAECGICAAFAMAIVPAHLMRSMGGGFDNESVAVTAMVVTFYCWVRSLRATDPHSHWFGVLTGLAYFYMVAAWGGYVFVLNLIGVHAGVLAATGRFNYKVYMAYTLFYGIGTALAVQVPVVGWAPLKSLEQLGPCAVFLGYQVLQLCEVMIEQRRIRSRTQKWALRIQVGGAAFLLGVVILYTLTPSGYFGPMSSRVRGLFVKHTKTGNPLVDSVAEHQPASSQAYFQYLNHVCTLAPIGYLLVFFQLSDASSFLLVWGATTYFFSHKMVRLILLTAPIGCILSGILAGHLYRFCVRQWTEDCTATAPAANASSGGPKKRKTGKKVSSQQSVSQGFDSMSSSLQAFSSSKEGQVSKRTVSFLILVIGYLIMSAFVSYSWRLSYDLANPTIIQKARTRDGTIIRLDDYREAYWWVRDNTPKDARIMAWWDYGYQISAIANRTTLADGNTWNHEHIALLGKALTTDLEEGWEIARNLADYMLIWGGGGGDDLAKSPHLARIANSVYRDHCPGDPTCRAFGFVDRQGTPSAMMRRSLLYNLHGHGVKPDVQVSPERFQEVFRSKYGKVRVYKIIGVSKESKEWVLDNRKCDQGQWFCPGSYPPGLQKILKQSKDFSQLEDFNRGSRDDEYQEQYFKNLQNPSLAKKAAMEKEREMKKLTQSADFVTKKDKLYKTWEDSTESSRMWDIIDKNKVGELKQWLSEEPHMAYIRSKDGRGPVWWAFEKRNEEISGLLLRMGVPHTDKDATGLTPSDLVNVKK